MITSNGRVGRWRSGWSAALAAWGVLGCAALAPGQATIRARDVTTTQWSAIPGPATATPAWNQQVDAWRLGVAIENMETGVRLTDVERGMPADRAGLKRDDVVISVGGYQVGYVDGALFDLGDEMRRRADAQGRVTMLAFDARNRQLRSQAVMLAPQATASGVRGQVLCRERISFSSQAVLTVRLRDVTYPTWQNVVVGQQQFTNPTNPPIAFSIAVDPSTIYADHRYAVDAWLADRGQVIVQTAAPVPVNPLTNTSLLQVNLVRPTGSAGGTNYFASQLDQINQWYRQYLLRDATSQELAAWQAHLQAGRGVQEVQAYLLSSTEYFDRVGNQSGRYLTELYRNLYGRAPTQAELAQFQSQYQQYGGVRTQFVQDVLRAAPRP